ncbi:hypothetical protein GYH30_005104 [Glycine max]|uniref:Uncharacterized protein n=1 Tax=Glycine max TaxID=3847 RepID=K7KAK4_SOYBN|nr:hypothetical protein GYH30_005104 [Glycine max]
MQQLLYKSTRKSSSYYHTTSFLLAITSHSIPLRWPGLAFFYYVIFSFSLFFFLYILQKIYVANSNWKEKEQREKG